MVFCRKKNCSSCLLVAALFLIPSKVCVLNMNHALDKPYHDSFPTDQVDTGALRNVNLWPSV